MDPVQRLTIVEEGYDNLLEIEVMVYREAARSDRPRDMIELIWPCGDSAYIPLDDFRNLSDRVEAKHGWHRITVDVADTHEVYVARLDSGKLLTAGYAYSSARYVFPWAELKAAVARSREAVAA